MSIILGIDPGSRCTGYGLIEQKGSTLTHITHGCIRANQKILTERLLHIFTKIETIIAETLPDVVAIEQAFVDKNIQSALKLGQARGVLLLAASRANCEISEYAPRELKQAVVGYGAAQKSQIQHMVRVLLKIKQPIQSDAADALGIAITHAHLYKIKSRIQNSAG